MLVKPPDDHPGAGRIFGSWAERQGAEKFCESICSAVDAANAQALDDVDYVAGYAYVLTVRGKGLREARRWATKGEN